MWRLLLLLVSALAFRVATIPPRDEEAFRPFDFTQLSAHRWTADISATELPGRTRTTSPLVIAPPSSLAASAETAPLGAGRQDGSVTLRCGSHVLQPGSYIITHPGSPGRYPNLQNCVYSLSSGPGWPAQFSCPQFSLEAHSTCDWDWLEVNGTKYCGSSGPPASTGVHFSITFHSDSDVTAAGYRCELEVPEVAPCGVFTLPPGTYHLQSPSYPSQYSNNQYCAWNLTTAGAGDLMSLSCDTFAVESHSTCNYDWLQVGRAKYCGFQAPPPARTVNTLTAAFYSDYSVTENGFHCSLTVTENTCCGVSDGDVRGVRVRRRELKTVSTGGGSGVKGPRVVGGVDAVRHALSWQAALVNNGTSSVFCGASLITDRHLLTAAHCVDDLTPGQLEVLLDEYDTTVADGELRRAVTAIDLFPGYSQPRSGGDFALLRLNESVAFGAGVRPACLPPAESLFSGAAALVSGWGVTSYPGGSSATVLQQAEVQILTQTQCADSYANTTPIRETMVCAAGASGQDTCQGDSGGPLVTALGGRAVLVGVTSFGIQCGTQYPGVYGRVTAALDWLAEMTADDIYC